MDKPVLRHIRRMFPINGADVEPVSQARQDLFIPGLFEIFISLSPVVARPPAYL